MLLSSTPDNGPSLALIEGGLTTIAIALPFAAPRLGSAMFNRIEGVFTRLARRQGFAVMVVGLAAFLLRLAILPIAPIPLPFVPDDFSFLLAGDTFAHGRLANPTPAMWVHFESIHITMQPTYVSMYFPAQGLVLAASKVLLGNPWFGVLLTSALMCAALCWMLQAWLPPAWALLGGLMAVLRLSLFSYWINTYSGGGLIAGLAGALVLGAFPRLMKTARPRYSLLLGLGAALLVLTRPYEGLLLCLPVTAVLLHWVFFGKNRPSPVIALRSAAAPLLLVAAATAWLGYYDYRAFGKATTLPYTVDRATYATAPYYVWQSPRPEPVYRHPVLRTFYYDNELAAYAKIHSISGFLPQTFIKLLRGVLFFAGIALVFPLIMIRRVILDRRIRFLIVCVGILMAGMVIEIFMIPHYLAPFTGAFYAIGLQAMRHLWVWQPGGNPAGRTIVRLTVTVCVVLGVLRLVAGPLHLRVREWPASLWTGMWYGPEHFGVERAQDEAQLEQQPGKQLVLVRYTPDHNALDEWVYNAADIDGSKVVWAREMGAADNMELIRYYKDRRLWLVQPDLEPTAVSPYPVPEQAPAGSR
jgi:hypothetical protein